MTYVNQHNAMAQGSQDTGSCSYYLTHEQQVIDAN